jgi:hypothetical protein
MPVLECPRHQIPMEIVPAELRSRCTACGYTTRHVQFEHCPQCGRRMLIEEPEPHWHCPQCVPVGEEQTASHGYVSSLGRSSES